MYFNETQNRKNNLLAFSEGWISIGVNILLFGLKLWAGIVSGSVAIIADAWHTLTDSVSSVIVLIGVKVSKKPPDKRHPFGHGRAELISTLFIAFFLGWVAIHFAAESIEKLKHNEPADFGTFAIIVTIVSVVLKEALARYAFWVSRKIGFKSMKADGWHHRTDAISSLVILIGILFGRLYWWVDGVLGLAVSVMILYSGYKIMQEAVSSLLGEKAKPDLMEKIKRIADSVTEMDIHIHDLRLHDYVNHKELTCHIVLPKDMSLEDAHEITTQIEDRIFKETLIETTIHCEPRDLTSKDK
ncbi:MAG: cation transporter [Bacteroidetes bacterium]|nr:cation transporter [Bacteroidota bacterium]